MKAMEMPDTSTSPLPLSTMRCWAATSGIRCIWVASNVSWVTKAGVEARRG